MTELAQKELKAQGERAIEMGGHLRDLAATYDLNNDTERHHLRRIAEAYAEEQTKYEYMRLQAGSVVGAGFKPAPTEETAGAAA